MGKSGQATICKISGPNDEIANLPSQQSMQFHDSANWHQLRFADLQSCTATVSVRMLCVCVCVCVCVCACQVSMRGVCTCVCVHGEHWWSSGCDI